MKKLLLIIATIIVSINLFAQTFSGIVKDTLGEPIYLANVTILSKTDSSLIAGTTTDTSGKFSIDVGHSQNKFIMVSFVGFKSYVADLDKLDQTIVLENDATYLETIEIKAQRQLVKLDEGKLVYDAEVIRQKKVVVSAFDVIVELPTLYTQDGNSILMVGNTTPKIIINGKVSTMNYSTLIDYLKGLPAEKVENVEFSPSAPPEWFVGNGPAINVIIKKEKNYFYSARIGGSYRNYTVNGTELNGSGYFSSPKWDVYLSGKAGYYVNMGRDILDIKHHVTNQNIDSVYKIHSESFNINRNKSGNIYSSLTYKFTDSTNISLDYVGNYIPYRRIKMHSENTLTGDSKSINNSDDRMNSITLTYQHSNLFNIGAEYTNYQSNYNQLMQYAEHGMPLAYAFDYDANQVIDRIMGYFNASKTILHGWTIFFGAQYTYTNNDNTQKNISLTNEGSNSEGNSVIKEHAIKIYGGFRKRFMDGKLFVSVNLKDEYYNNDGYEINDLLPQIKVSYSPNPDHYFVFDNYNQRDHPSYWNLQDYTTHIDKYQISIGNPYLKPSWANTTSINYYFKQKYQIGLAYIYCDPNLISTPYMRRDTLLLQNELINQQMTQVGMVNLAMPIEIGKRIISRFSTQLRWQQYKDDDWHGEKIDDKFFTYSIYYSTDFILSTKPRVIFNISANYDKDGQGGMKKTSDKWGVSMGLRANLFKDRLFIALNFNDIFETNTPIIYTAQRGQYYRQNYNFYKRTFFGQITYTFKGYKQIREKGVDTSRFGLN